MKVGHFLVAVSLLLSACSGDDPGTELAGRTGRPRSAGGDHRGRPGASSTSEVAEISVKAYRARPASISTFISSYTTLEPIRQVAVIARVSALVERLDVEEGSHVRQGQTMAVLDDREILNEFKQAQIAVDQAEIQVRQAQVRAEQSDANHARSKSLQQQKLISRQDYDQTALTQRTDRLAYEVAQQQHEAAKARLEAAQLQIDYTTIKAPIGGVVTQRLIEVGDRVSPNQEVFRLQDFTPLWARIFIPERELSRVRTGQTARIHFEAFPDRSFSGRIKMISPTVDAASGTIKVTLEVSDAARTLRPGLFGVVDIPTETRADALVIPKKAVLRERDENRVYVIKEDGTVEKRSIELGISQENRVEVTKGLKENDAVITVGQESLNDGYPVKVLAWETDSGDDVLVQAPPPRPAGRQQTGGRPDNSRAAGSRPGAGEAGRGTRQGRPANGQRARGVQRSPEERMAFMKQRIEQNPELKKLYDEQVKKDPEVATDPQKFMRFVREHFQGGRRRR